MPNETTSLNFVGDVAIFKQFEKNAMDALQEVELPAADFNVANFEFPLSDSRDKYFYDVSDEYSVTYDYAKQIKLNKFNLYGLANNHIYDYGLGGIEDTCNLLAARDISYFGLSANDEYNVKKQEIKGVTFAFVAAVKEGRWNCDGLGPNIIDPEQLARTVANLTDSVDHVIIYLHWGSELIDSPIPTDVNVARALIDAGASCVIGHHPHVSQGIEEYNGGLIAYSLGSFIYLSEFEKGNVDKATIRDISICLNIEFSKNGILSYVPYKYKRSATELVPTLIGDFNQDPYFTHLNTVIGDERYYSKMLRTVLLKRELISFLVRFKESPLSALGHYLKYIKLEHFKKILGVSK